MRSIDELEDDPNNNLVCGYWDKVYDEYDRERLVCPWCGTSFELDPEEIGGLDDVTEYKKECPECDRAFYFRPEHTVDLYSKREPSDADNVEEIY